MVEEAASIVAITMPVTRATRAIPALRITTVLTIAPDRRHPPAQAAARALRPALQPPRILVRRRPGRPAPAPALRVLHLQAPRIAQAQALRPDQVTVRRHLRHRNPLHHIQAVDLHNELFHPTPSRSFGLLDFCRRYGLVMALFYTALRAE